MSDLVSYGVDAGGSVGVITVDNPPVNALSPGVPEGIADSLARALADDVVRAVVVIGGGTTFIAGADIRELAKITSGEKPLEPGLHELLDRIEAAPKPVVCAIHGTAFGGGLEVAQACHYRVAAPTARLGQPEVKLGIIPGAAGTQRLPRLVGLVRAAEMCAFGQPVPATEALDNGLVDRIIDGDLREGAIAFASEVAAGLAAANAPPRRTRDLVDRLDASEDDRVALQRLREEAARRARGQVAPLKAIDAVELAASTPFDEGVRREAEIFRECLFSDESRALVHAFFAEREVRKIPGIPKDTPRTEIRRAAVVGAGTMGGGIAMSYANAGIPVLLKEADQERLDRGIAIIRRNYESSMKKGRLSAEDLERRMALIEPTLSYEGFTDADIVVEAVFEAMDLKKQVFREVDAAARPGAILATNTSTLDIDEIASVTARPEMVIGHHFFSPANVMRLLEIVRGAKTADGVIATSMALAGRLGKVGVLVGNCVGFVANRMFGPYMREAEFLVEEGAAVEEVDTALCDFGMAMGPLAVGDLAGLDVGWRIRKEHAHLTPAGMREPLVADQLYEMGRFGQKTGAGWYRYEEGSRAPVPDPGVARLIAAIAGSSGIEQREWSSAEIVERTVYALVNEGARILEEGYALRAADIDMIYIYGFGFPAWRGGPMWYADTVGLERVLGRVREFEERQGFWWKPAPLLEDLAGKGKTFADLDSEKARG